MRKEEDFKAEGEGREGDAILSKSTSVQISDSTAAATARLRGPHVQVRLLGSSMQMSPVRRPVVCYGWSDRSRHLEERRGDGNREGYGQHIADRVRDLLLRLALEDRTVRGRQAGWVLLAR